MGAAASTSPLVSGLMTCRNSEAYIEEALDSAMAQSYENVEVVVSDNASTDSTPEILREYSRRYPERVRVEFGSEDVGPASSRNRAFGRARGEMICWLDSDDRWKPDMVSSQLEVMNERPEVGLVHGWFETIDEHGDVIPGGQMEARAGDLLTELFVDGCFIGAATTMFRRRALEQRGQGLRDSDWVYGDDYYGWLVISLDWQVAGIDRVLASYRMHGENVSATQGNHFLKRIEMLREFTREFPEAKERLGKHRRLGIAGHYLQASAFEAEHGSKLRAARLWLHGALRDPRRVIRGPAHRMLVIAVRAKQRLSRERPASG